MRGRGPVVELVVDRDVKRWKKGGGLGWKGRWAWGGRWAGQPIRLGGLPPPFFLFFFSYFFLVERE